MGDRPKGEFSATAQHMSMLQATIGSKRGSESWLYSYKRSFNGFVAKLTEEEKTKIASEFGRSGVCVPKHKKATAHDKIMGLHGLSVTVERRKTESDVIVGMLDSGIWPESPVSTTKTLVLHQPNGREAASPPLTSLVTSKLKSPS
ncbi:Cucumisin [Sesamum angolense]|uniref:Cucumisin n=1 Tax=Sesamum angolense TaxID=2727404 RepID=A0AAE2BHC8_9LAMI|nr:Cucumisin [Sesamum angolense]